MMPTFPRSPLTFRTAGFPSVRLKGWRVRRDLADASISLSLLPAYADLRPVCLRPSCFDVDPRRVGSVDAITAPPCGGILHLPPGALARVRVVLSRSVIT